jgi:ribosomal protein S18 acetylase RimI-like enzyme
MIGFGLRVRRVAPLDYDRLANLTYYGANIHRHLDWYSPLEWMDAPNYWVREEGGQITAALACPDDPPQVAWIRFFGYHPVVSAAEAWSSLWDVARREMGEANQPMMVAAIVVKPWFQNLLSSSGFDLRERIVMLELKYEHARLFSIPAGIRIRPMETDDMPTVAGVDLKAFGPFWHNTERVLNKARLQCASATVAEDDSGIIGYQLSMKNSLGAHLARLAVIPAAQGRGAGAALVSHLIRSFGVGQLSVLSVNTQADNTASLALYKKLGFLRTGEQFPVFVHPIGG